MWFKIMGKASIWYPILASATKNPFPNVLREMDNFQINCTLYAKVNYSNIKTLMPHYISSVHEQHFCVVYFAITRHRLWITIMATTWLDFGVKMKFFVHFSVIHLGQWRGALMFSLICAWIKGWVKGREAGDLRRHCSHYDIIVMAIYWVHGQYICSCNNVTVNVTC